MFPTPPNKRLAEHQLGSADSLWHDPGVQDSPVAAVVPVCGGGFTSSSSQSSLSDQVLIPHQEHCRHIDRQPLKPFRELTGLCVRQDKTYSENSGSSKLECFVKPTESPFNQERNYVHAMEVSFWNFPLSPPSPIFV